VVNVDTIVVVITFIIAVIGSFIVGRHYFNGSGIRRTGEHIHRAGDAAERAGEGIDKSLNSNRRAKKILERGRAILKKARKREQEKNSKGNID